jgi:hypothetical protein
VAELLDLVVDHRLGADADELVGPAGEFLVVHDQHVGDLRLAALDDAPLAVGTR